MAKSYFDSDLMVPDKEFDYIALKLQKKILKNRSRRCHHCGVPASFSTFGAMPTDKGQGRLKMFLSVDGVAGVQEIKCQYCEKVETITSLDCKMDESKFDTKLLRLKDSEVEHYSQLVDHKDIINDLLELLLVAAISDSQKRKQRHTEVTSFMLQNAKLICEEWCRPEHSNLRYSKFLVMFKETSVDGNDLPEFSTDVSNEYKETYRMLLNSFHTNRKNVELLRYLLKDTLFDSPTPAAFMMWIKIAMLHVDQLQEFENLYGNVHENHEKAYTELMDSFLSVDIPVGLKKIPVVFVLFELPRFYHYCVFYKQRCGLPSSTIKHQLLTDADNRILTDIELHTNILKLKGHDLFAEEKPALYHLRDKFLNVLDDIGKPGKNQENVDSVDKTSCEQKGVESTASFCEDNSVLNPRVLKSILQPLVNSMESMEQNLAYSRMNSDNHKVSNHMPPSVDTCTKEPPLPPPLQKETCTKINDSKTFSESHHEAIFMPPEPPKGHTTCDGYRREMLDFDFASSKVICVGGQFLSDIVPNQPQMVCGGMGMIPTTFSELPFELQKILNPFQGELNVKFNTSAATPTDPIEKTTNLPEVVEKPPSPSEMFQYKRNGYKDVTEEPSEATKNSSTLSNSDESTSTTSSELRENEVSSSKSHTPRSKKPHFKYGMKWKKNKMTYDVDKVTDGDSDKEEEYTYYPCKLLNEYVDCQNIVETATTDLLPNVICLTDYLKQNDIHHSLWTIKKKYIQNELFIVLDIDSSSGTTCTLPRVSASNNRGVSVPVLPILDPNSDSSALDWTIGTLYCMQVTNKLTNKQRNIFLRYVRIAVARARHSQLFDNVSLGAIKYVKTNSRGVEVKLSVRDMQYEARNEEESERRKIIRLLKRAGEEQDLKKKIAAERNFEETQTETIQPVYGSEGVNYSTATFSFHVGSNEDMEPIYEKEQRIRKTPLLNKVPLEKPLRNEKRECDDVMTKKVLRKSNSHSQKKQTRKENKEALSTQVINNTTNAKLSANITGTDAAVLPSDKKGKVTFRDKFNTCSFCTVPISDRIRICSGCRNAAYCNSKCQKSHWKEHKKKCVYALTKDQKEVTG